MQCWCWGCLPLLGLSRTRLCCPLLGLREHRVNASISLCLQERLQGEAVRDAGAGAGWLCSGGWEQAGGAEPPEPPSAHPHSPALIPTAQLCPANPHALIPQDEGTLISEIPGIATRDGHATDEEKLASTTCTQKAAGLEKKGEPEDDLEYFECSNVPVPAVKPGVEAGRERPTAPGCGCAMYCLSALLSVWKNQCALYLQPGASWL